MKLNKFFMGILGALALTACSSDDVIPEQPTGPIEIDETLSRYMSVQIRNANPETRADGDYENGKSFENEVKSVRFYFFDEEGKARAVKADGTNFIDVEATDDKLQDATPDNNTDSNIEKILTAVLAISTEAGDNIGSLKSMVAIVNGKERLGDKLPGDHTKEAEKLINLSQLRDLEPDNYDFTDNVNTPFNQTSKVDALFLMTSSVFGSDNFECEVKIEPQNLKTKAEDALSDPVKVYVERVLAKVKMSTEWKGDDIIPIPVTYNDQAYEAIPLKNKKGGTPQTTVDGEQIYVIFTGWGLQTVADKSYLFKKVNNSFELDWNWKDSSKHRSYWALNPSGLNLINFKHSIATQGKLGSIITNGNSTTNTEGDFFYCQENAGDDVTTGYKDTKDLDNTLTNRTQAYVGGLLVTVKDGVASPVDIAEWGGTKYVKADLLTAMLGAVNDQIYTREDLGYFDPDGNPVAEGEEKEGDVQRYEYSSITVDDIELIEEEVSAGAPESVNTVQNGKRYLSRIQLTEEARNKTYYQADKSEYASPEEINLVLRTAGIARVWGGGTTYYFVDLNHIGKTGVDTKGNSTNYGVVRNHIYDVRINSVYGLGTPILRPARDEEEKPIKPEKPGDDESFLGVQVHILSWRIVDNSVSLDW